MKYFIDLIRSNRIVEQKKTSYGVTLVVTREMVIAIDTCFLKKIKELKNESKDN